MLGQLSLILFLSTSLQQAAEAASDNHTDGQSTAASSDVDQIVIDQLNNVTST